MFFLIPIIFFTLLFLLLISKKNRAIFFEKINLKQKALNIYNKLAIEEPNDADIHIKIAQLLEDLNRDQEAIMEYKLASKILSQKAQKG